MANAGNVIFKIVEKYFYSIPWKHSFLADRVLPAGSNARIPRSALLKLLLVIFVTAIPNTNLLGQNRYLSIGLKKCGIGIGNAAVYNGLRLNLWDKNARQLNGINISALSRIEKVNGISLGLLVSADSNSNGIKVGGLYAHATGTHNGLALSCIGIGGKKFNGLGLSGWISADTLNGVFAGWIGPGIIMPEASDSILLINGLTGGLVGNCAVEMNGLALGFIINAFIKQTGMAVAVINSAEELHGIQFGLINRAANNRKLFRWTPFVNFNFRKNSSGKRE